MKILTTEVIRYVLIETGDLPTIRVWESLRMDVWDHATMTWTTIEEFSLKEDVYALLLDTAMKAFGEQI